MRGVRTGTVTSTRERYWWRCTHSSASLLMRYYESTTLLFFSTESKLATRY